MVPGVLYFRVFDCKAYVHIHKNTRVNKLQAKVKVMMFVGYEIGTKGYRFWDSSTRSIVVICNATFNEKSFSRWETGPYKSEPVKAYPPAQLKPTLEFNPKELFPDGNPLPDLLPSLPMPDKHQ